MSLDIYSEYAKEEIKGMHVSNGKADLNGEVTMKVSIYRYVCIYVLTDMHTNAAIFKC